MPILSDAQKAIAAFVLTTIGSIATWALTEFPDDDDVQTWAGLAAALVTVIATTYGVWKVKNHTPVVAVPTVPPPAVPPVA